MMHKAWSSIEEVPYCFSRTSVQFQGHTAQKIVEFDPNWAFPDSNSSLNTPMAKKWCTKLEVALERCPIVFQGYPSNFKVTRLKKLSNLTQIGRFRTVTQVWIHRWLWNVAQSLKQQRRDALLFSKVIQQISRSHGTNITDFDPYWAFPDYRPVAAFKSLRFVLLWIHYLLLLDLCNSSFHNPLIRICIL